MTTILWIGAVLLVLLGLAGIMLPALPGTVLVLAGLILAAWTDGFQRVGWGTIAALGSLTALSLIIDLLASSAGAKRAGASRQSIAGAAIGAVIGIFFGLPGLLLGPFLGAVAGEFLARRDLVQAGRAGIGAWLGLVLGSAIKLAIAFAMIGLFIVVYLTGT